MQKTFVGLWILWVMAVFGTLVAPVGIGWKLAVWGWFVVQEAYTAWKGHPTLSATMTWIAERSLPDREWFQGWPALVTFLMLVINFHGIATFSSITGPWEQWWLALIGWPLLGGYLFYHWLGPDEPIKDKLARLLQHKKLHE